MNKKESEKKKQSKKIEKQKKKDTRKTTGGGKSFDDMIAYVDENGMITDTPPDITKKSKIELDDIAISTPKKTEEEPVILTGRVEYFNSDKGYGFIKDALSTNKYFFHINQSPADIAVGDKVSFDLEKSYKGMIAVSIQKN